MPHSTRRQHLQTLFRCSSLIGAGSITSLPLHSFANNGDTARKFPLRAMRILNPFPVGGGPDGVSRLVANKLSLAYGLLVVVENRPGANGFLAIEAFRNGARDGHDLMVLDLVHLAAYPWLFKRLPYDPQHDFTALMPLFRTHFFIVVGKNSPYQSLGELLSDARTRPHGVTYGSWAIGSPAHLGAAMLAEQSRTQMRHVAYKETSQLYTEVANGTLSFAMGTLATTRSLLDGGRVRLLAVAAPRRVASHRTVPTVTEAAGLRNFEVSGVNVLVAPSTVPGKVADQLWQAVRQSLQGPDVDAKFTAFGYEPFPMRRSEMASYLAQQRIHHQHLVRAANITPM